MRQLSGSDDRAKLPCSTTCEGLRQRLPHTSALDRHRIGFPTRTYFDYKFCIAGAMTGNINQVALTFLYQNKNYGLLPVGERSKDQDFRLNGVALSKSGRELLKIVDIQPSQEYMAALTEYFVRQGLQMVEIKLYDSNT